MPLPILAPDVTLWRVWLLLDGQPPYLSDPGAAAQVKLSLEPDEAGFFLREKLTGGPLHFSGADFRLLYAIEASTARCQLIGVLLEHRASPAVPWAQAETWRGSFRCSDAQAWNVGTCSVDVLPAPADGYQLIADNQEKEYNLLLTPTTRQTVTAKLVELAAGISLEFMRVGRDEQADYEGQDGWTLFLQNTSWIPDGSLEGVRESNNILFRYRLRSVPMTANGQGGYTPVDKSQSGYQVLLTSFSNPVAGYVDYVKAPAISGFKPYKIGTYSNWNDPRNPAAVPLYGPVLLLLDASKHPSDYGYTDSDYVRVTGVDGYGANNSESPGAESLNVRRYVGDEQYSGLWWRFGTFAFTRCFRLRDGLYSLLAQTLLPLPGGAALLPPSADQLGDFLTADTNLETGDSGAANEVPRLLFCAGSDMKNPGDSEAATRLLISLKALNADLRAGWQLGWFIDPATGWVRYESQAYLEQLASQAAVVDLRLLPEPLLPEKYAYRDGQTPRYEDLTISAAGTEDVNRNTYFAKASVDYGIGGCASTREGSNRVGVTVARLTGDVALAVLSGDAVPDNAVFVLAPDATGHLANANREVSATGLIFRYWRRARAAPTATVEGPAPLTAPNTVTQVLPVSGPALPILSVRPSRQQEGASGRLARLATLATPGNRFTTNLGVNGVLGKAELTLGSRIYTATVYLGAPALTEPPVPRRQFDDSFDKSFG